MTINKDYKIDGASKPLVTLKYVYLLFPTNLPISPILLSIVI